MEKRKKDVESQDSPLLSRLCDWGSDATGYQTTICPVSNTMRSQVTSALGIGAVVKRWPSDPRSR